MSDNPFLITGIYTAVVLAVIIVLFYILAVIFIFLNTTYRNPFKKRVRECTNKKDEAQMRMFLEGVAWAEGFKEKQEELHIVNDGLNLFGEYTNLGFDKCVVIVPGRSESLLYSYYFADVYAKNGHNIFVMDLRSYGLSDGKYQTGGIKESDDIVLWIKYINEKYKIKDFTIHGICIGGAAAVYTYCKLKNEGSGLIKRIITDGLYKNYFELYRGHIKVYKVPFVLPALYAHFFLIFLLAKVRPFKHTPLKCMKDINVPILFICSVMDKFCTKPSSEEIFKACSSLNKEIFFFTKGRHSFIRASQKTEYDNLIAGFLQKHI